MQKTHLLSLGQTQIVDWMISNGYPPFRADQLQDWLYKRLETDFGRMHNLPKNLIGALEEQTQSAVFVPDSEMISQDGTIKWALKTPDSHLIETVMIPDGKRRSLCISSQVGCAMGCSFCRTAKMGLIRNLTVGEILEQVHFASRWLQSKNERISNIIFMGMGEPLHNLEAVASACDILNHSKGFGISHKKITVSTSGIVPKILEWAKRLPQIKLAISLNASNNEKRSQLMPINRRYPLEILLATADEYVKLTGQKLTFEYILIQGETCTREAARELKHLASHHNCKINLIPLNPGDDPALQPPEEQEIEDFQQILSKGDFQVLRRKSKGRDILAACGQLATTRKGVT